MIRLVDSALNHTAALQKFTDSVGDAGAIVSFTGLVRFEAGKEAVTELLLEAYSPLTENGISKTVDYAKSRWALVGVDVLHRVGRMQPKDPIVFVATASRHRRDAFEAADFLMDYLKTEAVFWKKETTTAGTKWIEPRREDYADAARWQNELE